MPTLAECSEHLGLTEAALSIAFRKLKIQNKILPLDEIRKRFVRGLSERIANRLTFADEKEEVLDLNAEKAKTEKVSRELKELQLAEKRGMLINISQLEAELNQTFAAFRAELLARDDKLARDLGDRYGIEVDAEILNEYTYRALEHLARYDPSNPSSPDEDGEGSDSSREDEYDRMGEEV